MTVSNALTIFRLVTVPAFVYFYAFWETVPGGLFSGWPGKAIAAALFVLAGLSDVLDGYLARKRNEVTWFGTLIDPVADKLSVIAALVLLVFEGRLPLWLVVR